MDRALLLTAISILAAAFIAASVFAYYPLKLVVQPVTPPITFAPGSNAGKDDLRSSNTITVSISTDGTSAEITIHPTYHTTYYKNVTVIENNDNKRYNVSLVVETVSNSNNLPPGSKVYMIVFSRGASRDLLATYPEPGLPSDVNKIELTVASTNSPISIGSLAGGGVWEIDFMVYIPEGASLTGASATFNMHLVYSPSEETPP